MADKIVTNSDTAATVADAENTAAAPTVKRTRPEGIKRVGVDLGQEEYALLRESRFVKRLDKDSDVIKAALNEFFAKHGITL